MCKTGDCNPAYDQYGNKVNCNFTLAHTQCEDGRWICSTCYHYECCVDAGGDLKYSSSGVCGNYKCNHRPKLVNNEWTFWKYQPTS